MASRQILTTLVQKSWKFSPSCSSGKKLIVDQCQRKEIVVCTKLNQKSTFVLSTRWLTTGSSWSTENKRKLQECYFWLNIDEDIKHHITTCLKCQTNKADKFPRKTTLQSMPQCSLPNQRIHLDLFGPCKTSDMGNKYILTMTDAFTKYAEVVAIPNKEATTVSTEIFNKWICRYGCPAAIHTDQGK